MSPQRPPPLGELLVGQGFIQRAQLDRALRAQQEQGGRLGDILEAQKACSRAQIDLCLQAQIQALWQEPELRPEGKVKVMVVDDSALACTLAQEGLSARGFEVLTYTDPREVLAQVDRVKPDVVLTDLLMPEMNGVELCHQLKQGARSTLPVIIITLHEEHGDRVWGLRSGADDYVSKAMRMDEVAARIDRVVVRAREAERVRKLFARYTSPAIVEEVLKGPDVLLNGERREVTLLFADLRSFTALTDALPPERTVELLNLVLGTLSEAVLAFGGTLDKFLGDGLMALFGAPLAHDDDAHRALQAARQMMRAMQALPPLPERQGERLQLGIGLNSGVVVAGSIGGAVRSEYTCIGDAVNVAARLCALAGPGEILMGARTQELLVQGSDGKALHLESLPPVQLKGKAQLVPLFRAS